MPARGTHAQKPLIRLDGIDVVLNGRPALQGVRFTLRDGERWAILGGNGSGKTTLLRTLRGDQWPTPETFDSRTYFLGDMPQHSPVGMRRHIGFVSAEEQESYARRNWQQRGEEVIKAGFFGQLYLQEQLTPQQQARYDEIVDLLEIRSLVSREVAKLSQGEARKILIARALAPRPRALFLDEVCNGLDPASRDSMLQLFRQLASQNTTFLFTTHREEEIIPEVTHVAVLAEGRIVAQGPREETLPIYRELSSSPALSPRVNDMPYPAKDTLPSADQPLIEISKCDVWVEKVQLLHDINFALRSGEHWGIVGLNGSGKSSFLKFLHGDYRPALGGTICRFGQDEYASVEDIHALFGYVGMELQAHYHYNVTALEAAASGFFSSIGIYREVSEEQLEHARMWLTFFSMGEHAERPIHEMSHGQLRRVLLARAMVHGPRVLLLDEPFNGLDRASHAALTQTLEELAARGVTLFIATHHMEDLVPSINRIAVFHGGRMIRQGPRGEVLHGN